MKAVIIMGPPGSGKSTQARLLADKIDYVHLDTGAYLEAVIYDPTNAKNREIAKERRIFEKGGLLTPSWVLKIVKKRVEELARAKTGVILSGSPRTLYEAFGDKRRIGLMKTFEKGYGRKNIVVFEIKISPNDSIDRNSHRLICSSCRSPILKMEKCRFEIGGSCPFCGGKLRGRTLDSVETIKNRLKEYRRRTHPVVEKIKKSGYQIIIINGRFKPCQIHEKILENFNSKKK
ncbi:nucleoside monophosphate kinase [Candidatus Wolfebacteria bacterium]|nr:nucleoside monophosphate kinase [Candidatus Wolfebacteria bacterium]